MTMRPTVGEVAARLQAEGLAGPDEMAALRARPSRSDEDDVPWFVRAAVGVAAWAATAFLLSFLFGVRILEHDVTRIVVGVVLIVAALAVRRSATAEFMRQAAVAMSLAGQGLVIVGTGELTDLPVLAGTVGVVMAVVMIVLMPDRVHRFLCTLIAAGCAVVALRDLERGPALEIVAIALVLASAVVWRIGVRERSVTTAEMLEPVGYGLLVALFGILIFGTAMSGAFSGFHERSATIGMPTTLIIAALLCALVVDILREHGRAPGDPITLVSVVTIVLLAALTRTSPGILAGITVLLLGFDRRSPLLTGMAALFLTVFTSVYYYNLELTLIEKAGVLAASGALLLAARALLARGASRPHDAARSDAT